ncbi:hypothetical protein IKG68_00510 [Candidatus Saccharibacteria bacterium]|nr:hypothetical protein [Candidatus Saccharibacteria bacterium]
MRKFAFVLVLCAAIITATCIGLSKKPDPEAEAIKAWLIARQSGDEWAVRRATYGLLEAGVIGPHAESSTTP